MPAPPIYVETSIDTSLDILWEHTQTPDIHERWDLRFSSITYLPRSSPDQPQQFLYRTNIGFGLGVEGKGEAVGSFSSEASRSSALKFWSDGIGLITEGSGYWKYDVEGSSVRFLTQYDYRTRFGVLGRWFDRLYFRPLLGWATAWSFDSLRLWLEQGIDPTLARWKAAIHACARLLLGFIWIYQGVFPKLLYPHAGERQILQETGLFPGVEGQVLFGLGLAEVMFGLLFFVLWRSKAMFVANNLALVVLTVGALLGDLRIFVAPFNPVTLNTAMLVTAMLGWFSATNLPSASRCLRQSSSQ